MLSKETFSERLKSLRKSKDLTIQQVAEGIGVSKGAISQWENGTILPSADSMYKLSKFFKIDVKELFDLATNDKSEKVQDNDIKIDSMVSSLDLRQKQIIHDIVKAQLGIADNLKVKPLKLFDQPACAGTGNYIDSQDYEIVEFINPPKTAEYAIKVQGDSMSPLIDDGDIVYINSTFQLFNNDIGVFAYQGETFIKQYKRENGRVILHALNPKFDDIEILYPDEFYILGRVL